MKTALICGVGGPDGPCLARALLGRGGRVVGTSRDARTRRRANLRMPGIDGDVEVVSMALNDFRRVLQALAQAGPAEVSKLAGQSSVGLSFEQPVETLESIRTGTLNLLEGTRFLDPSIRVYDAGSSACFGNTGATPADEETPFRPRSPYAVAKTSARNLVASSREACDFLACTGLLFDRHSPLPPKRFVARKIVAAAHRIGAGLDGGVTLGNLDTPRDRGCAPEYVEAMWQRLPAVTAHDPVMVWEAAARRAP